VDNIIQQRFNDIYTYVCVLTQYNTTTTTTTNNYITPTSITNLPTNQSPTDQ
jgi:hypothetical protein